MESVSLFVVLFVAYVGLSEYVFRFQRTTRSVSQLLVGHVDRSLQTVLTPNWMGALGWFSTGLAVATGFCAWLVFGWLAVLGVAGYALVIAALVDVVSPLPTYRHCFDVMESCLQSASDPDAAAELIEKIRAIRGEYGHSSRKGSA